ncbi:MAG TPA: hypothetical protein VFG56_02115 [Candidatus Saccharimonadales bacterium]|nr:hypothetical protein [Candidatus Saccharimonadales bacterium]
MEPNFSQPGQSPERHFPTPEISRVPRPEVVQPTPEKPAETREVNTGAGSGDTPPPVQPAARPLPAIQQPAKADNDAQTKSTLDDNPIAAGDDDLIEKEWVDKAKQIISETKDDPYAQEKAVNQLQADYLKKRYGRTVKLSDN